MFPSFFTRRSPNAAIGGLVAGGTANSVLFIGTGGVLDESTSFTYDDSTFRMTVGTGSGTSTGWTLGYYGASGYAGLWTTVSAPTSGNFVLASNNTDTLLNAPTGSGNLLFNFANTTKATIFGTTGAGITLAAGTATTDVNAFSLTQTWNAAVAFTMDKANATATSATNGSAVIDRQVNGGSLFRVEYYAANVTAAVGATATATNLIPAKAQLIGIATRITTELGASTGTTGYTVGDGTDADRWGTAAAVTVGTVTDQDSATADPSGYFNAANNVVLTATGGNFDGTGVIRVVAAVLTMQAPTS